MGLPQKSNALETLTSAAALVTGNIEAFALRLEMAETATSTLNLQYYIWRYDLSGRLLARAILKAADRGVKVRLLLDDINAFGMDRTNISLDSHPNIDIRLFNPSRSRTSRMRRLIELALKYVTASRRMHNKNWVTDNKLAIVGGRNIGDAYFDASSESNFRDTDALLSGPVVVEATEVFEAYWQSKSAVPIRKLHRIRRPNLPKLQRAFEELAKTPEAIALLKAAHAFTIEKTRQDAITFSSTDQIRIAADPPEKAQSQNKDQWLQHDIRKTMAQATSHLRLTSPYFIPGGSGVEDLAALKQNGVTVRVITNSLATTDVAAVHGAYSKYRVELLERGIELFELKPEGRRIRATLFGSRSASLHTKSFVVDDKACFVGSFNLDPRSASINTEMGIFMNNAEIARKLTLLFDRQRSFDSCYKLKSDSSGLQWLDHGGPVATGPEPGATVTRRILAKLVSWLPIETQL